MTIQEGRTRRRTGSGPLDAKRRGRLMIGSAGVVLGLAFLVASRDYALGTAGQPGAGVFPLIVGIGFVAVSVLTCMEALFTKAVTGTVEWPTRDRWWVMAAFALCMVAYVVLLPYLGQYICSVLFMTASLRILGRRPWPACLLGGVASGLTLSYVFINLLSAVLPTGPFGQ